MEAMSELTSAAVDERRAVIEGARMLVLDCNLDASALRRAAEIAASAGVEVVVDPVSVAKSARLAPVLEAKVALHTITPNVSELGAIVGTTLRDDAEVIAATRDLHSRRVTNVWVRLGSQGSLLSSSDGDDVVVTRIPAMNAEVVDVTGAGDAMTAGYVCALVKGYSTVAACAYGHAAAALTIATGASVATELSWDALSCMVERSSAVMSPEVIA